jgi:hypothetical protein
LLVLGIAFRVVMLVDLPLVSGGDVDVYLADEGVVGLMGKHIAEGRALPVFFYGQHYLGALEAYAAAAMFTLVEPGLVSLRAVTFLFSLGVLAVVYRFAYVAYSVSAARWATALVAVAPLYFLQWNLKARGGFVEHLFLIVVVMILFWRFYLEHDRRRTVSFALGFATGVALWVNQLALAYVLVMGLLLIWGRNDRRGWSALVAGGVLGASLLIGYNVVNPAATVKTLGRKFVVLNRVPVEERDEAWIAKGIGQRIDAIEHGAGKLGLVFGVPPTAGIERLGLSDSEISGGPLTGLRSVLWPVPAIVFGFALWSCRPRRGATGFEPVGSSQLLALFFLITFVVGYVSPRYMLPAYPLAAIMAAALAVRSTGLGRRVFAAGLAAVFVLNLASWADALLRSETVDESGAQLIAAAADRGIEACYSAGPMYHVVFESNERLVLSPLQKNRIPAYDEVVEGSQSICYVFRDDQATKRQHVAFVEALADRGVRYERFKSGKYNVFAGFEPRAAVDAEMMQRVRSPAGRAAGAQGTPLSKQARTSYGPMAAGLLN